MFDESQLAGQLDADLLFGETEFLELVSPPGHILFVGLGHSDLLMEIGISDEPYTHPYRPDVIVRIDLRPIVPGKCHDDQVTRDAKESLVFMHDEDIVNEPE